MNSSSWVLKIIAILLLVALFYCLLLFLRGHSQTTVRELLDSYSLSSDHAADAARTYSYIEKLREGNPDELEKALTRRFDQKLELLVQMQREGILESDCGLAKLIELRATLNPSYLDEE